MKLTVNDCFYVSTTVIENCSTANFKVEMAEENVAGVKLPVFRRFGDIESKNDSSRFESKGAASSGFHASLILIAFFV